VSFYSKLFIVFGGGVGLVVTKCRCFVFCA